MRGERSELGPDLQMKSALKSEALGWVPPRWKTQS
jgi:hypothetical protein